MFVLDIFRRPHLDSLWNPVLGTTSRYNLGPLHQVTLLRYYNESKDTEDFVGQSMPQETFRPAKSVGMIVHKMVRFLEAIEEVLEM